MAAACRRLPVSCLLALLLCTASTNADEEANLTAVVKVHSKNRTISLSSPWRKQSPRPVSGSGVIIGPGQLLTNAHVVLNTTEVTLQPFNSSERIPADVKILAPGIDLALLEFEPTGVLADVKPLELADESPKVQSTVRVYGYPTGGDSQSVTEGIVSRIEHTSYRYGTKGMRIQIDAAINAGNSGGPAMVDGRIAGLAFSVRSSANDIGYVIPTEEIQGFLKDVEDGTYDGKADFHVKFQYLENKTLRRKLGIPADTTGVLCHGVREQPDSPLQDGDVITKLADYDIDNRGRCRFKNDISLSFTRLAIEIEEDGVVPMTVLRDGAEQQLQVPVETRKKLIDYTVGRSPRYFIYGPVLFSEATADYNGAIESAISSGSASQRRAMSFSKSMMQASESPLLKRMGEFKDEDSKEELVVVTKLLTHATARGYRALPYFFTVKSINDQKVTGFAQMVELLRDAEGEFVEIQFHDLIADVIVLDRQEVLDATEDILEDNGIVRQGSRDLMKVWNNKD
ncbi:S1C family serine protease [Fuerstiella marisgermanici]|uniref:Serine protease HtrA n=1 Tax=Fuerstiella marisgermanici TaxID=1891926 RepID=A0A1P8WMU1_9PLAN|nr:S1C family serine protease [Fuerstiella marisgermanici]APZ95369.1 Putative serine protease HtrA [Fuerstiella marisgermanici]